IGYVDAESARRLVCQPKEGFPDIYPPGGVDHILERTRCHPYLIQRACEELCKRLNSRRVLRATDDDLQAAFDVLLGGKSDDGDKGIKQLWEQRTDDERALLLRMLGGENPAPRDPVTRSLLREEFIEERDGKLVIAVPLFREWIAKNG